MATAQAGMMASPLRGHSVSHPRKGVSCEARVEQRVQPWLLCLFAAGLMLIWLAKPLAQSAAFRVTSGGILFTLSSLLVLTFLLYRMVPQKRLFVAVGVAFSGVSSALLRYFLHEWGLTLADLLQTPLALAFLLCSFLAGLAIMYYYDSPTNYKLHNIIHYGMQLGGMALLYFGTSLPELAYASLAGIFAVAAYSRILFYLRARTPAHHPSNHALPTGAGPSGWQNRWNGAQYTPVPHGVQPAGHGATHTWAYLEHNGRPGLVTLDAGPGSGGWDWDDDGLPALGSDFREQRELVQRGYLLDGVSARLVAQGRPTHKRLVREGAKMDPRTGVLWPHGTPRKRR